MFVSLVQVAIRTEDEARKLARNGRPENDERTMFSVCPKHSSLDRERSQDSHAAELTPKSI